MTLHFLNDRFDAKTNNYVIITNLKSESFGNRINRIPGSRPLVSSSPGSALRMHVESLGKPRKSSTLQTLPGKLDIKRHLPSILYLFVPAVICCLVYHLSSSLGYITRAQDLVNFTNDF